ncbi:hypothetical protein EDC04DRAFT_1539233 [Pisolithus marmoratus]|nr:hypothetical protein EDC04DRAFT_1539233 [Pisolithus marmoratus]
MSVNQIYHSVIPHPLGSWFVSLLSLQIVFYTLHAVPFRFLTFSNTYSQSKCLPCLILCHIQCNILLNRALVPYLCLNTYTFCCR